jgi:hypothetical protein
VTSCRRSLSAAACHVTCCAFSASPIHCQPRHIQLCLTCSSLLRHPTSTCYHNMSNPPGPTIKKRATPTIKILSMIFLGVVKKLVTTFLGVLETVLAPATLFGLRLMRPKLPLNHVRLEWFCTCGVHMYAEVTSRSLSKALEARRHRGKDIPLLLTFLAPGAA